MQVLYRKERFEDIERIIAWCRKNNRTVGGPFEVYTDPGGINRFMVAVNLLSAKKSVPQPLGAFYCNYLEPGTISFDKGQNHEETGAAIEKIGRIKSTIDLILKEAQIGKTIDFTGILT